MRPILSAFAAASFAILAAHAQAQIFQQGPVEIREYRNPNLAPPGHAHGIETENMFGFTLGSDTDEAGTTSVAWETVGGFGRRGGSYTALGSKLELAYGLTDDLSASVSLLGGDHAIHNVPGLADTNEPRFDGFGTELRWRLLQRGPSPIGLTLHIEPSLRMANETSGQRGMGGGSENKLIIDAALVPDRLFAAVNLTYDLDAFRPDHAAVTEHGSAIGFSGALSAQVAPQFFLGGELRYARAYDGLGLNRFLGEALFLGPTLFWHVTGNAWIAAAFNAQVAGHTLGQDHRLDLIDFNRYQARLKIGVEF